MSEYEYSIEEGNIIRTHHSGPNECLQRRHNKRASGVGRDPSMTPGTRRCGNILIVVIITLFTITLIGLALADVTCKGFGYANANVNREQALQAADAGIDYVVGCLNNGVTPATGSQSLASARESFVASTAGGTGRFASDTIVTSIGTAGQDNVTVVGVLQYSGNNVSPVWSNALTCGSSPASQQFSTCANIHGSVNILGEGDPKDCTNKFYYDNNEDGSCDAQATSSTQLPCTCTCNILNTYDNIESTSFCNKVPALPVVGGDYSLGACFRMQYGCVNNSGGFSLGETTPDSNATGFWPAQANIDKCCIASGGSSVWSAGAPGSGSSSGGSWVWNGWWWVWQSGSSNASVDCCNNGCSNGYDLPLGSVRFPSILYPVTCSGQTECPPVARQAGDDPDYITHISRCAATYTGNLSLTPTNFQSTAGCPASNFPGVTCGSGTTCGTCLKWFQDPTDSNCHILQINGVIRCTGSVTLGQSGETVTVRGCGSIISGGSVVNSGTCVSCSGAQSINVNGNLVCDGTCSGGGGMPKHCLGLCSCQDINVNCGTCMACCFAQRTYCESCPCNFAGSICCSKCNKCGSSATGTYQVPAVASSLPPGMPGGTCGCSGGYSLISYQRLSN